MGTRWIGIGFLAVGCGGDFCSEQAAAAEDCGAEVERDDVEECRELLAPCDSADQRALSAYLDCVDANGLLTCEGEDETLTLGDEDDDELLAAMFECFSELGELSTSCLEAFTSVDGEDSPEP